MLLTFINFIQIALVTTAIAAQSTVTNPVVVIQNQTFPLDPPSVDTHLPTTDSVASLIEIGTKSRYPIPNFVNASSNCTVIQVQMVARHGTRNPTSGNLATMTTFQTQMAAKNITSAQYAFLSNFSLPSTFANAGILSGQGQHDHVNLAKRVAARFPRLVADSRRISWQATNVSRAIASGQAFISGLFGDNCGAAEAAVISLFNAVVPRTLDADLRAFDSCTTYLNEAAAQKNLTQPDDVFNAVNYLAIAKRIARLVGVQSLTLAQVKTMFDLCSFDNTLQGLQSRFCGLFTAAELSTADFSNDLSFNFIKGYAVAIDGMLACSLLTTWNKNIDMMLANASTSPTAVFKFAHAETIVPIITTLGLFQNVIPLSPGMTPEQIVNRTFRSARFSPFAANVMIELLDCGDSDIDNGTEGKFVRVSSDEIPIVVPGCPAIICPLDTFRNVLSDKIGCDFDKAVCGNFIPTIGGAATFPNTAQTPLANIIAALNSPADNN
ncbi:PHOsphatase [Physocladia obscura]|uniref:Multiple inositol polyphosphate phosphatase 1 n=1 Tax=Physocladia obscura TaxID=109957 RepID=A0AAD5SWS2_9FUNG|nr:PHOsphatase [Physocladia obscura]